ncbi:hypothetical protein [Amycolatopsis sp. H20-H5]|uniref:hypothetical protein n=1 Tax=Amycolatopsis sp. H20-H5 TaxID=3046309 RepID=UPI002DC05761|nr:hypothetical protein [Amycolatopsis sp. H20-H5]MEC3981558.1 hypothetical protein [Amycolatopsis sp. H20-H5]
MTQTGSPDVRPWLAGIAVALTAGAGVGVAAAFAAGGVTAGMPGSPPPAVTVTAEAPPATAAPIADDGPRTRFADGLYRVGTDMAAGAYTSAGPAAGEIRRCFWARLKAGPGTKVIANGLSAGATRFTVKNGEYVQISGCEFVKT